MGGDGAGNTVGSREAEGGWAKGVGVLDVLDG